MPGITELPTGMAPGGAPNNAPAVGSLTAQEAATLGRLLGKVSTEEIDQLRELSQDLKGFSLPELKDFLGGVDYIMQNAQSYRQSVRNLIAKGIVEPGDLPAEYVPTFFSILRQMIMMAIQEGPDSAPEQMANFAKGGLVRKAEEVRQAGRHGDTMLAHITPQEARALKAMGGAGTINPETGLPEFKSFWSKVGGFLKKAAPIILPIALSFIPGIGPAIGAALGATGAMAGAIGGAVVGAVGAGVGGLIAGQKPGQALLSAALGGAGGFLFSGGTSALSSAFGGGAEAGALQGASAAVTPSVTAAGGEAAGAAGASGSVGAVAPTVSSAGTGAATGPVPFANPATQAASAYGNFAGNPLAGVTESLGSGTSGFATSGGLGNLGGISSMLGSAGEWAKKNPIQALTLAGMAGLALSSSASSKSKNQDPLGLKSGPTGAQLLAQNPEKYGFNPENFKTQPSYAKIVPTTSPAFPNGYYGELPGYYGTRFVREGGHISGPGTGTSDSVPAMLSDGEFVLTAKAVRGAGNGDRIKGAKRLYKLMNSLERRS